MEHCLILFCCLVSLGSQIASWFPSFSVEVMHTRVDNLVEGQLPESRIEAMVRHGNTSVFYHLYHSCGHRGLL